MGAWSCLKTAEIDTKIVNVSSCLRSRDLREDNAIRPKPVPSYQRKVIRVGSYFYTADFDANRRLIVTVSLSIFVTKIEIYVYTPYRR